jgi:hypothetical protein
VDPFFLALLRWTPVVRAAAEPPLAVTACIKAGPLGYVPRADSPSVPIPEEREASMPGTRKPGLGDSALVSAVTEIATRRQEAIHFAGFLVQEDDDAVYIADTVGTWVVPRESLLFIEDWGNAGHCAPEYIQAAGRPVRVGVADGATVHEIRPWKMKVPLDEKFHEDLRRTAETIFTLGGAPPETGAATSLGEKRLGMLEQVFSRPLGWNPSDPCTGPVSRGDGGTVAAGSHTIVVNDGYCDADPGF